MVVATKPLDSLSSSESSILVSYSLLSPQHVQQQPAVNDYVKVNIYLSSAPYAPFVSLCVYQYSTLTIIFTCAFGMGFLMLFVLLLQNVNCNIF